MLYKKKNLLFLFTIIRVINIMYISAFYYLYIGLDSQYYTLYTQYTIDWYIGTRR